MNSQSFLLTVHASFNKANVYLSSSRKYLLLLLFDEKRTAMRELRIIENNVNGGTVLYNVIIFLSFTSGSNVGQVSFVSRQCYSLLSSSEHEALNVRRQDTMSRPLLRTNFIFSVPLLHTVFPFLLISILVFYLPFCQLQH